MASVTDRPSLHPRRQDWNSEASKMCKVFRGVSLTIFASHSESATLASLQNPQQGSGKPMGNFLLRQIPECDLWAVATSRFHRRFVPPNWIFEPAVFSWVVFPGEAFILSISTLYDGRAGLGMPKGYMVRMWCSR
jgi:hypothetical protein